MASSFEEIKTVLVMEIQGEVITKTILSDQEENEEIEQIFTEDLDEHDQAIEAMMNVQNDVVTLKKQLKKMTKKYNKECEENQRLRELGDWERQNSFRKIQKFTTNIYKLQTTIKNRDDRIECLTSQIKVLDSLYQEVKMQIENLRGNIKLLWE